MYIQCCRWKLWNVSSTHIFCAHTVLTAAYDRLYVVTATASAVAAAIATPN